MGANPAFSVCLLEVGAPKFFRSFHHQRATVPAAENDVDTDQQECAFSGPSDGLTYNTNLVLAVSALVYA